MAARGRWVVAVVLACGLAVAGCGGGSTRTRTVTRTVTVHSPPSQSALDAAKQQLLIVRDGFHRTTQRLHAVERQTTRERATLRRLKAQVGSTRRSIARGSFDGEGTYLVGQDIEPGTYRAAASPGCYWARLASLDTSDITDNDNADGPVVIDVLSTDRAVEVHRCATFHRISG